MTNIKIQNPAHEAEVETAEQSEAQLAILDRAQKLARQKSREDLVKAEHDARMEIVNSMETNGTHVVIEGEVYRKPNNSPKPTVEAHKFALPTTMNDVRIMPSIGGGMASDPATEGMNEAQKKLYGVPLVKVEPKPKIILKTTQPSAQNPPRGKAYSDLLYADAEATRRAAELSVRPVPTTPEDQLKDCPVCSDRVSKATAFHTRTDGTVCIIDKAFALREGILAK